MFRKRSHLFISATFILVLILFYSAVSYAATVVTIPPTRVGDKARNFTLKGTDGKDVSLEDFKGKVILLSFWDCYADVCFTSVNILDDMVKKYPPDKFVLLTVCYVVPPAMEADNYKNLLKSCSIGQVILIDKEKKVKELYQVKTPPTSFLIDSDLIVQGKITTMRQMRSPEFMESVDNLVTAAP